MRHLTRYLLIPFIVLLAGCATSNGSATDFPTVGRVTAFDPSFHTVVSADARIEKIAEGFTWSEGPAWVRGGTTCSSPTCPRTPCTAGSKRDGLSVFLKPSGLDGPDPGTLREAGANGLFAEPAARCCWRTRARGWSRGSIRRQSRKPRSPRPSRENDSTARTMWSGTATARCSLPIRPTA